MSTKTEQATALHKFLQNENIVRHLQELTAAYHPMIVRPAGDPNAPWELTEDEAQSILRTYLPDLSAVINGSALVIFREKERTTLRSTESRTGDPRTTHGRQPRGARGWGLSQLSQISIKKM